MLALRSLKKLQKWCKLWLRKKEEEENVAEIYQEKKEEEEANLMRRTGANSSRVFKRW